MYRRLYACVDGKTKDIMEDGDKSCAVFVTATLVGLELCKTVHATVEGAIRDMEDSGWKHEEALLHGCVMVWEVKDGIGKSHLHIGFYVGNGQAVSNSSIDRSPQYHPCGKHVIHASYWHPRLD
ncbi:MAG: hypothetical protein WCW36_01975 [Candidatus Paceibacterota bacterium]|jgi:hypothetical protein